jgi:hypothetical protein
MTAPRRDASARSAANSADWTVQAADTVETVVGAVRDKATVPLRTVARAAVYGIALGVVAAVATALGIAAAVRGLTLALAPAVGETAGHRHRVWVTYAILGGIFTLVGLFLLRKAEATPQEGK